MNMISTGAFQTEMDASNIQPTLAEKFAAVWEKKNAKAARAGGVSLMALSLAACGSDDSTTTTATTSTTTSTTTTTTTTVAGTSSALTVANDAITGAAGDDTVSAARIDTVQTFNSGDTIALGAGADTLTATLNAGTVTPAAMTGVETVTFTALGAATADFDNVTGVTSIHSMSSTATLTVDDIQALTTSVKVSNNTAAQTFTFKTAAAAGTADSLTLNLDGAGAVVNIGSEADADGDIETMVINNSGGASDLGAGAGFGADATSITVTATAALDMGSGDQFAKVTAFDGSASTAGLTVHFADRAAAGETAVSWSTGSGADTVDIDAVTLANFGDIVVDLGAGADTLTVGSKQDTDTGSQFTGGDGVDTLHVGATSMTTATFAANVTGFEVLQFLTAGNQTQDMDFAAGMNIISISDGAVTDDLTVNDAADGLVIRLDGALLSANDAGITTGDDDFADVKVNLKTDTANDDVTLEIGGTLGDVNLISLDPNVSYETVTVTSSGASANAIQTVGTAINNMTFTGATALSLLTTGSMTGVVDAGAMTGAFTATTAATVAITVIGGSGADTLTFGAADNVAQTLRGGAGNDTLASGAVIGQTTGIIYAMDGGAGNDTISTTNAVGDTTADGLDATFNITTGTGIDIVTLDTDADISHDIIITESLSADVALIAAGFESGAAAGDDDIDYNGTLLNDANTTVVKSANTTLATALSSDVDATVYVDSGDLTGSAASTLTTLGNAATTSAISTAATAFIAALVELEGTVAALDSTIAAGETVLMAFDNGTDSAIVKFTNSSTAVANTITIAELELIAVTDGTVLATSDII
jgi:hypothetical protein